MFVALSLAAALTSLGPAPGASTPTRVLIAGGAYLAAALAMRRMRAAFDRRQQGMPPFRASAAATYLVLIAVAARLAAPSGEVQASAAALATFGIAAVLLAVAAVGRAGPVMPRLPLDSTATWFLVGLRNRFGLWTPTDDSSAVGASNGRRFLGPRVVVACWLILLISGTAIGLQAVWNGPVPRVFISPDESNNKLAAMRVAATGAPILRHPFEDEEDLLHPRLWTAQGSRAFSIHAPLVQYLYGGALALGRAGEWFPYILAGVGIAALSAGGIVIARSRPWAGALLPLLALPVGYWMLRPWMNFSVFLTFASLALLSFSCWARLRKESFLVPLGLFLALAGATRPDQMVYLLTFSFLAALLIGWRCWRLSAFVHALAGISAAGLSLVLNWLTTGHALQSGYQLAAQLRGPTAARDLAPVPLSILHYALAPTGLPAPEGLAHALDSYWFLMGPVWLLVPMGLGLAALAVPQMSQRARVIGMLAVLVAAGFWLSRFNPISYGMDRQTGALQHDFPRYTAMIYLLAGAAILAGIDRLRGFWPSVFALAAAVLAVSGALHLYNGEGPDSLVGQAEFRKHMEGFAGRLEESLPPQAVLYSLTLDRVLTGNGPLVASVPLEFGPVRLAESMIRAEKNGYRPFVAELSAPYAQLLTVEVEKRGYRLIARSQDNLNYLELRPDSG